MLSHIRPFATLWTVLCEAPLSAGFSRQEYWSGLLFPFPGDPPAFQGDSFDLNIQKETKASCIVYNILICVIEKGKATQAHTYVHKYAYVYVKYLKIKQEAKSIVPLMWVTWCWELAWEDNSHYTFLCTFVTKPFKWITYQKNLSNLYSPNIQTVYSYGFIILVFHTDSEESSVD